MLCHSRENGNLSNENLDSAIREDDSQFVIPTEMTERSEVEESLFDVSFRPEWRNRFPIEITAEPKGSLECLGMTQGTRNPFLKRE
jgi:hypothetical protein